MTDTTDYILGTDPRELDRLSFQHQVWVEQAYSLFRAAGFRAGDALLDAGCGPGFTSVELAHVVGPEGSVIARDQSPAFVEFVRREGARLGLPQVEPSLGPIEALELDEASLDGAYARWLFCWVPDPGAALARVARSVRPGGVIALQEYLDWATMSLLPRSAIHTRAVEACMESWRLAGGTIDVAAELPRLARESGLELESLRPVARAGPVGSLVWRWIGGFLASYLPRLVDSGLLTQDEVEAHRLEWQAREAEGTSHLLAPLMADALLRRR